jgi:imidazole glycerol-phosphate synthase subunit HisF
MPDSMFYGASPIIFELAKKLRNNVTATEMILWGRLKEYFPQLKFRRQHPVSVYIADFYCHSQKLIIEIDGSIHNLPGIIENDEARQKDLEELGIRVIRFTNKDILSNLETAITKIKNNIQ